MEVTIWGSEQLKIAKQQERRGCEHLFLWSTPVSVL